MKQSDKNSWREKLRYFMLTEYGLLPDLCPELEMFVENILQTARKEAIFEAIDRIEMWADDGSVRTTDEICQKLQSLLK